MHPPLVPYGNTFPPQAVGLWVLSYGAMSPQPDKGEPRTG